MKRLDIDAATLRELLEQYPLYQIAQRFGCEARCQRRRDSRPAWRSKSRPVAWWDAVMTRGPIGPLVITAARTSGALRPSDLAGLGDDAVRGGWVLLRPGRGAPAAGGLFQAVAIAVQ